MKKLSILFLAIALTGCTVDKVVSTTSTTRDYTLVAKDPPKHFYVDLKDNQTGEVLNRVYVSKHCNSHNNTAIIGKTYTLTSETRVYESGQTRTSFVRMREAFCQ